MVQVRLSVVANMKKRKNNIVKANNEESLWRQIRASHFDQ